jgi:hypothetical protein
MSNLPRISGRECVKVLNKVGFYFKRQEGSHIVLRRDDPFTQELYLIIRSLIGERSGRSSGLRVLVLMSSRKYYEQEKANRG